MHPTFTSTDHSRQATDLARFNALLSTSPSATATLIAWVEERSGRDSVSLMARATRRGAVLTPSPVTIAHLEVNGPEAIICRRVRLMDGRRILSDAHNFYVPSRLTERMQALLTDSDIPFGTIIAPLSPRRDTLRVERYWPTDEAPDERQRLPARLLRHDAIVRDASGVPLCVVSEVYTRNILL
ncbi:MAG: hypothetical protein AB7D33_07555 [Sphingobium sp.]